MMGLNYNWSAMASLVDNMYPNGNTNQPIGLVWGWLSLVGGGPLVAPAKDPNYKYTDVIVLMSDGLNTQDRWYTSQTSIDKRMYGLFEEWRRHLRQHQELRRPPSTPFRSTPAAIRPLPC